MKKEAATVALALTCLQFSILCRPTFKVPEKTKDNFCEKLADNVRGLSLPEKVEDELIAMGILAVGSPMDRRITLAGAALELLEDADMLGMRDKTA